MHLRSARWPGQRFVASCILAALADSASAQLFQKTITYTRFFGDGANIRQAVFNYDAGSGTTFFSNFDAIATTPGADGVLFAPDGDLIIGGQGPRTHKVVIANGSFTTVDPGGVDSFHVMLDPSGTIVWTASVPGVLASVPLRPFANGTAHAIVGADTSVTHLAFAAGQVFYTSSQPSGLGSFGTIDLATFTTTRIFGNVPWAHGMVLDCYTGDVIAFANSQVAQIDPVSHAIVSLLDAAPLSLFLDQGTSDGEGRLYIASNTGHMLFIDITNTRAVGTPDFVDAPFLDAFIDDIAPDCGLGAPPAGVRSQGFWKNHPRDWALDGMTLGCRFYSKAQCLQLFKTPVRGDASLVLAHQLMATRLNIANGSLNWPDILPVANQADALLCQPGGVLPQRVRGTANNGARMIDLAARLDAYNSRAGR